MLLSRGCAAASLLTLCARRGCHDAAVTAVFRHASAADACFRYFDFLASISHARFSSISLIDTIDDYYH
jgi:hypothetical protein